MRSVAYEIVEAPVACYIQEKKAWSKPLSYGPTYILSTAGKFLNRVIQNKIFPIKEHVGSISQYQYEFRRAWARIEAINLVVDITRIATDRKWDTSSSIQQVGQHNEITV